MTTAHPPIEQTALRMAVPSIHRLRWYVLFLSLPAWWLLGLGSFIWPVLAVPLGLSLLVRGRIHVPPGFGIWLTFILWTLVCATQLTGGVLAYAWRESVLLASTVVMLAVFNAARYEIPSIARALVGYFALVVAGGYLGLAFPSWEAASPMAHLLPQGLVQNSLVQSSVMLRLAQTQHFLGHAVSRPETFFPYTNTWGAACAIVLPLALFECQAAHGRRRVVAWALVAASVVPITLSLNRGLWVLAGIGMAIAALRALGRRSARGLTGLLVVTAVVAVGVAVSPLGTALEERLSGPSSTNARANLARSAFEQASASPLFGYGGPSSDPSHSLPPVGSQGEVYLLVFSFGFVGLALYLLWLAWTVVGVARGDSPLASWLLVAVILCAAETVFYEQTIILPVAFAVIGLAWRVAIEETA